MAEDQLADQIKTTSKTKSTENSAGRGENSGETGSKEARAKAAPQEGKKGSGGDRDDIHVFEAESPLQLISFTELAAEKVREIFDMENLPHDSLLRVRVVGGGCAGFSYDMYLEEAEVEDEDGLLRKEVLRYGAKIKPSDKLITSRDVNVVVDQMSLMYLVGTEIDYLDSLQASGFKFNNPQVKSTCGCGSSFS